LENLKILSLIESKITNTDFIDFSCFEKLSVIECPVTMTNDGKVCKKPWTTVSSAKNKMTMTCEKSVSNTSAYKLSAKDQKVVSTMTSIVEKSIKSKWEKYKKSIIRKYKSLSKKYKTTNPQKSAIYEAVLQNIDK